MERIAMSQEERDWLEWLKRARDGHMTQRLAAEKMGVSDRWVRHLLAEWEEKGDGVVVHGLRGRPSNRRIDEEIRKRAMEIVKSADWQDFKPTFASEQLAKRHEIKVSKETVRQWMMAEGIWQTKGRKVREVHQWRPRRSHYGELVQWDTSDHDWLEGRGEAVKHLVRMIDDATSRSWGRFVARDATRENMGVLFEYVTRFGRAVDYYTDRDSMFAVAPRPGESKEQQRQADRTG
jgi:DNA-binding Lrp family transcriptional regulator